MGDVIQLPSRHGRASAGSVGYKSGRNSWRGIPVSRSIGKTNSPGTPFFDLSSQYQTCDCVVPIRSAKGFCPPATSQARRNAAFDMQPFYPLLGEKQPKNLCVGRYLKFGYMAPMREIDKDAFARRVIARLNKLEMSQSAAARQLGVPQQTMQNICRGMVAHPRFINELAELLLTTREWLLFGNGPEIVIPKDLESRAKAALGGLTDSKLVLAVRYLEDLALRPPSPQNAQKPISRAKKRTA